MSLHIGRYYDKGRRARMRIGEWSSQGMSIIGHMNRNWATANKAMLRLSTGYRINSAADDPAGLAISEKMRGQIRGLNMASKNIMDGISLLQTAEGAINETHAIIQRVRELAVQAANDTNTDEDRQKLQLEVDELLKEITRTSTDTEFNTRALLNGDYKDQGLNIQVGANSGQYMEINIGHMSAEALGLDNLSIATQEDANNALGTLEQALNKVSHQRAQLGAYQNRLEHAYNVNQSMAENLQDAESRIRDTDIAKEMMNMVKAQILAQVGQQVLAMHMQRGQAILRLLG